MKYSLVVCGGTFDHFHKGHREFLNFALSKGRKVLIGITSNKYIKDQKRDSCIEPYGVRKKFVEDFLERGKAIGRVEIEPIHSLYMPLSWDRLGAEAVIVSKNTIEGAKLINKKRTEKGLPLLKIIVMPQISTDGIIISSSLIREGKINREGISYINPFINKTFILPSKLRACLKRPFGKLCHEEEVEQVVKNSPVVTVGDVTSAFFRKKNLRQDISIVDLAVGRQKVFNSVSDLGFEKNIKIIRAINPQGFVTKSLVNAVIRGFEMRQKAVLLVDGEEDLAVLPAVLASPLGTRIFYGQPNRGIICIWVNESKKEKARKLMTEFNPE